MSEERSIQDYLDDILNAVYGEEVRESIVGAITKCYEDGSAGAVDVIARGRLDVVEPIAESAQETANANIWATLQVEKKMTQEGVHDLNACVETGKYYADTTSVASIVTNQPSSKTASTVFAVLVLQQESTSAIIQILIDSTRMIWVRRGTKSGSTWTFGAWLRFLSNDDLTTINTALGTKANKNNAQLTGAPVATTANDNDNSTRIATTAYVMREANKRATKASPTLSDPTLTGTAVAPTPVASSNDTTIATTYYVTRAISNFKGAFDTAMSSTSVNAVQNKVVNTALSAKANLASPNFSGTPKISGVAVATSTSVSTAIANQSTATTSAKGLMSATDKTYLDGTQTKSYGLYTRLSNITIDTARVWVFNRRGNICDVTFNFKITVHDANISANTAIIGSLPDCSVNAFVVMATKTGDSIAVGYVNGGKLYTGGTLTKDKTYYGNVSYCSNNANSWYEAIG